MSTIRVLHVLGELRPSGMERMLVSGVAGFKRAKIDAHILGVGIQHPYKAQLRAAGYSVSTTRGPLRSSEGRRYLQQVISEFRPDVVHLHTEGNYLQNVLAIKRTAFRLPIVRTVHNVFAAKGNWFARRFAQAVVADRLVSAIVVPSPDVADNEKRFWRSAQIIYNWIDSRFFDFATVRSSSPSPETPLSVAIVGNCSWIKNHDVVLKAALFGRLHVTHVGSEEHAESSEKRLLEELEQAGLLQSRGPGDPTAALLAAQVFAMPSLSEGMPVALAEALVVGLPAVLADAPGLRWAASESGVTMLSNREPVVWAEALRRARRGVEPLSIDFRAARGTAEYAEIYRALSRRPGGRT